MSWKTLGLELQITRADVSDSSLWPFNIIHTETRNHIESEELGFGAIPLLEILDAVNGGRRLSMVIQDHPKYRSKANLVFGKRSPPEPRSLPCVCQLFTAPRRCQRSAVATTFLPETNVSRSRNLSLFFAGAPLVYCRKCRRGRRT